MALAVGLKMAGVEDVLVIRLIEKAPALRTKSQGAIRLLSRQQDWHVADLGSISAQLPDTLSSVGAKFEPTRDLQESYGERNCHVDNERRLRSE